VKRAYEVFLANSQLCRQVLDKKPSADQTLLDIHFEACLKLTELRDACRALETSMQSCEPDERPRFAWLLKGANHNIRDLIEVFETWEEMHGQALKEAHRRYAEEILRLSETSVGTSSIPDFTGNLLKLHAQPHALLSKKEELELGREIEQAKKAYKDLSEFGWQCETRKSDLLDTIKTGQIARRRLALMNLKLVASIANKVQHAFPMFHQSSLTFEDLLQEGDVGLLHAIEKYDWRRGYRFSTYATYQIRQAIRKAILQTGSTIRIPLGRAEQIRKLRVLERTFEVENGRRPTQQELCDALKVTKRVLKSIQEYSAKGNSVVELDASIKGFEGGDSTLLARFNDRALSPLEILSQQEEQERRAHILSATMQKLTREELTAIGMRYGLDGRDRANYQEIAEVLGVPHENSAWRLVRNAIAKLQRTAVKQFGTVGEDELLDQTLVRSVYSNLMSAPASP
jgi:RNA polymerase sigma factor (sigma-70 family)